MTALIPVLMHRGPDGPWWANAAVGAWVVWVAVVMIRDRRKAGRA